MHIFLIEILWQIPQFQCIFCGLRYFVILRFASNCYGIYIIFWKDLTVSWIFLDRIRNQSVTSWRNFNYLDLIIDSGVIWGCALVPGHYQYFPNLLYRNFKMYTFFKSYLIWALPKYFVKWRPCRYVIVVFDNMVLLLKK